MIKKSMWKQLNRFLTHSLQPIVLIGVCHYSHLVFAQESPGNFDNKTSFTALRLAGPHNSQEFRFMSHKEIVNSGATEFETPHSNNYLEAYIKSQIREDQRLLLLIQSLNQAKRKEIFSEQTISELIPTLNLWLNQACLALSFLRANKYSNIGIPNSCSNDAELTEKTPDQTPDQKIVILNPDQRAIYEVNPLSHGSLNLLMNTYENHLTALNNPKYLEFFNIWAQEYESLFTKLYWNYFDASLKDWTWKMILQEESVRYKLRSPTEKERKQRFNAQMAATDSLDLPAAQVPLLSIQASFGQNFVKKVHYLLFAFEKDSRLAGFNFTAFKSTQNIEKFRSEYLQAVIAYLVKQQSAKIVVQPHDLRLLDQETRQMFSSAKFEQIIKQSQTNAIFSELVTFGQFEHSLVKIQVDLEKNKSKIYSQLKTRINIQWIESLKQDISRALLASNLDTHYLKQKLSETHIKAFEAGYSSSLVNQLSLYELAIAFQENSLNVESFLSNWIEMFQAELESHSIDPTSSFESRLNLSFKNTKKNLIDKSIITHTSLDRYMEYRVKDLLRRLLVENETQLVRIWKEKHVNQDNQLLTNVEQISQQIDAVAQDLNLVIDLSLQINLSMKLDSLSSVADGFVSKLLNDNDLSKDHDLNNQIAIHFDPNILSGVHIVIANKITSTQLASSFSKQSKIVPLLENRLYQTAFEKLRARLLNNYNLQLTTRSGAVLRQQEAHAFLLSQ